jgi:dihydroneopterin aldolase
VRIELAGIELHGFHGVLPEERSAGQRFLFDVEVEYASPQSPLSDAIEDAIDYRALVDLVAEVSGATAYHLIEALAAAVADEVLDRFPVARVRVRVRKPDVALGLPVEHAAVVVERMRSLSDTVP